MSCPRCGKDHPPARAYTIQVAVYRSREDAPPEWIPAEDLSNAVRLRVVWAVEDSRGSNGGMPATAGHVFVDGVSYLWIARVHYLGDVEPPSQIVSSRDLN